MPLGRQRLLQRFFNLHHCIATTRAKQKRTATPPRKRLSRPMTSIANGDKRRRASANIDKRRPNGPIANDDAFDHEERFGGQNHLHLQKQLPVSRGQARRSPASPSAPSAWSVWSDKFVSPGRTAQQPKSNGSSTQAKRLVGHHPNRTTRQLGSNSSSAQIDQFLIYALRTLTPIGARTAHAIKFIGKQTKRRKAHDERYHKRHKQNRELHDRPLSANAKAPIVCSPREFRERIKPFSTSAGKVQFAGIIMPHERKTHAKRRSKMKFNF